MLYDYDNDFFCLLYEGVGVGVVESELLLSFVCPSLLKCLSSSSYIDR